MIEKEENTIEVIEDEIINKNISNDNNSNDKNISSNFERVVKDRNEKGIEAKEELFTDDIEEMEEPKEKNLLKYFGLALIGASLVGVLYSKMKKKPTNSNFEGLRNE